MSKKMDQVFNENAKGDENEANCCQSPCGCFLQRPASARSSSSGRHISCAKFLWC